MCGICGIYGAPDKALVKKMADVMRHRGPDGEGFYVDDAVSLGHRRLAIIDLSTRGNQPMCNEDQTIWISFNGEIYNFKELRAELEKKGHEFKSATDTEAVIHLYEEEGIESLKRLNGIFAFAIWDAKRKRLLLVRDRMGVKPLFYSVVSQKPLVIAFASEIKALLMDERVKREIDLDSMHFFINTRFCPPQKTMFTSVKQVPPASYLLVENGGIKAGEYWSLSEVSQKNESEEYFVQAIRKTLAAAVKRQMVSDVPVGLYLSGGIDSSSFVAFASKLSDKPLKTFCMGFGEEDDEFEDARFVAEEFGTDHRELIIKQNLLRDFPKMIWHMDAPKRNVYPYYIAELVSKYVKVVQSGLGGDELFGGYSFKYYQASLVEDLEKSFSGQEAARLSTSADFITQEMTVKSGRLEEDEFLKRLELSRHVCDRTSAYLAFLSADKLYDYEYPLIYGSKLASQSFEAIKKIFEPYFADKKASFLEQTLVADFEVKMVEDFLTIDDRMSMAHSVEARVPFLDNEVVELAFSIPCGLKYRNGGGKYLLKEALANVLPKRVIEKKKQGFSPNTLSTFKHELKDYAVSKLPEGSLVREGFVKPAFVKKILEMPPSEKKVRYYNLLWNLLALELWYEIYVDDGRVDRPPSSSI